MKLTARQKYDYRDLDRGEAQLIRLGHALWRDRRKLGDTVAEREGINAALESVWHTKREYRAELAAKRALRFSQYLHDFIPKPLESLRKENIDAEAKNTLWMKHWILWNARDCWKRMASSEGHATVRFNQYG